MTECSKLLKSFDSIILVLSGDTDSISDEAYDESEKYMVCCTHEDKKSKTMRDFVPELKEGIKSLLSKGQHFRWKQGCNI